MAEADQRDIGLTACFLTHCRRRFRPLSLAHLGQLASAGRALRRDATPIPAVPPMRAQAADVQNVHLRTLWLSGRIGVKAARLLKGVESAHQHFVAFRINS